MSLIDHVNVTCILKKLSICLLLIVLCQNGDLRLVDGTNQFEGRLELCYNETWGTICDGLWNEQDANVACRQLGYQPTGAVPLSNAFFGQGSGIIWLDNLICLGDEERLLDCFFPGLLDIAFCRGHIDDAGLRCMEGEWNVVLFATYVQYVVYTACMH